MKRITLGYLATYLFFGGAGLLLAPTLALQLLQSNGDYGLYTTRPTPPAPD
jgi:hypothetical protein